MRTIVAMLLLFTCAVVACDGDDDGGAPTRTTADAASPPAGGATSPPGDGLPIIDLRYDGGTLRVEVATAPDDRAQGLGERDALADDAGMLFDLGESRVPGFWMKGMRFAIDMVWIGEDKTIAGVALDVQPQPGVADAELRRYSPDVPVRYVLEIKSGASLRLGLGAGERVEFELP
ncbi:MAG: DUF192 domain-containing protein [Dehalococcoidia bacterium]